MTAKGEIDRTIIIIVLTATCMIILIGIAYYVFKILR
jgi:hypothetical protein